MQQLLLDESNGLKREQQASSLNYKNPGKRYRFKDRQAMKKIILCCGRKSCLNNLVHKKRPNSTTFSVENQTSTLNSLDPQSSSFSIASTTIKPNVRVTTKNAREDVEESTAETLDESSPVQNDAAQETQKLETSTLTPPTTIMTEKLETSPTSAITNPVPSSVTSSETTSASRISTTVHITSGTSQPTSDKTIPITTVTAPTISSTGIYKIYYIFGVDTTFM
jgi:hypothetical protein